MTQTRETELELLRREIEECDRSPLATSSPQVVFGEGNPDSPMVIVGEGPGEREEVEGRPFVGRAGQLLEKLMASAGLTRKDIWITNVLKRRASKVVDGRVRNRLPRAEELAIHREFLERELRIISPRLILCLGNLAANALIHRNFRMTQGHGEWFSGVSGKKLMATFHPAYILRLEGSDYQEILRQGMEDFAAASAEYRLHLASPNASLEQRPTEPASPTASGERESREGGLAVVRAAARSAATRRGEGS